MEKILYILSIPAASSWVIIVGLLFDIVGGWFVLNTFFPLSKKKVLRVGGGTQVKEMCYHNLVYNLLTYSTIADNGSKISPNHPQKELFEAMKKGTDEQSKDMRESLENYFRQMGIDAKKGFILLTIGFTLQIIAQFI